MNICFATNNSHKLIEVKKLIKTGFEILSLKEIGCLEELPENQSTLQGNANEKARFVYNRYNVNCFADDTGLEVESLDGSPGVYSARYAGLQRSDADNIAKLLKNLEGQSNRNARFRTVISLIIENSEVQFEGIVNGTITKEIQGVDGFGYDPVFLPDGQHKTFAQMSMEEKNQISHRGIATQKLVEYLNKLNK